MTTKACVRLSAVFLAAIFAMACGDSERSVRAVNLASGQQQVFGSAEEVPAGWSVCPEDDCSTLPGVPCQNLGEALCASTPGCELVQLGCVVDGCAAPGPGEEPGPNCNNEPQCDVACMPSGSLICEQITDEAKCTSDSSCAWDQLDCATVCLPDGTCPPCPSVGVCRTVTPDTCDSLDATRCLARPDCEWVPRACPPVACAPDQPDCMVDCPAFCQAKDPIACIAIGIPEPACEDGHALPRYDENGCLVGYDCIDDCPDFAMPQIGCADGTPPLPTLDERGCVVGFTCPNVCPPIALAMPYCENGVPTPKYDAAGCITGYECEECPAIPMIAPDCKDNEKVVPVYNDKGCLTGYACQNECPAIPMIAPDCKDNEKVVPVYSDAGCLTGYRCEGL